MRVPSFAAEGMASRLANNPRRLRTGLDQAGWQRPGVGGRRRPVGVAKRLNDLTEGKSQQARTQERQADRRQG